MMLLVDVEPRFSAVQVLEHPWVNVSGSPFPWVTPCVPWSDCGSAHVVPASRECWVGVCPPAPVNMPEPLLAPREQEQAPTLLTGALHEALHLTQRTRPPTGEGHAIASPRPPPPSSHSGPRSGLNLSIKWSRFPGQVLRGQPFCPAHKGPRVSAWASGFFFEVALPRLARAHRPPGAHCDADLLPRT